MSESDFSLHRPTDPVGRFFYLLAYGMTIAGGIVLSALVLMVVVSVVGRALFSAPVYGDFEMVAMGTAISIFLFMPLCHLQRNNVIVDLFIPESYPRLRKGCDVLGSAIFGVLALVLAWRSVLGGIDMHTYHETTMILSIPVWWAFPFITLSMGVLFLCCMYTMIKDLRQVLR